ncbi:MULTISPECIES: hypothetical protein [unclassified Streptomyces]|uniref:hypothetical protein n=1 Tax=unclassified Streptomyces TaxID=2593676 RepID=UPI00081B8167|nr:hypothetical protein [Streptomyces sp. BvitLS-983]MYX86815.1 hypothetical protein [Streptomyces sp. SID4915]SCD92951.1 hypothetical protein GA0115250_129212 [Streptomyces sp. BvitLS-983]
MTQRQWGADRRVYGADHPGQGPRPGETYVELAGGPLDGLLLDVTDLPEEERTDPQGGAHLITDHGAYGPGGRADYAPDPGNPGRWTWRGDLP